MTVVRVDEILVTGKDDREYLKNLDIVLSNLADAGLKLKREKCKVLQPSVTYLLALTRMAFTSSKIRLKQLERPQH